jgi:hypothetical protein
MRRALRGSAAVSREQGARSRERMRLRMGKTGRRDRTKGGVAIRKVEGIP